MTASIAFVSESILFTVENVMKPTIYLPLLSLAALAACGSSYSSSPIVTPPPAPPPPPPAFATFVTLGDSVSIAAKLDEFRGALRGGLNAPNTPPADGGRR